MAFATSLELAQLSEKELGHDTSAASSQRADIYNWLDYGHKIVHAGGDLLNMNADNRKREENIVFSFAKSATPKSLILRAGITNATVSINRESTTLNFDAAPDGANSIAGWHIRVNEEPELYYISAHTAAATTATIQGGYVGNANVSSSACKIMKLRYDIGSSDILRLIAPLQSFNTVLNADRQISIVDKDELYKQFPPDQIQENFPEMAGLIQESAGTYTVQFSSYPADITLIECDFIPIPTTLDANNNPTMPVRFRPLLSYLACYFIGIRNNDSRAKQWLSNAQDIFRDMVKWEQNNVDATDSMYGRIAVRGFRKRIITLVQKAYV